MEANEAIERLKDHFRVHNDGRPTPHLDEAVNTAIDALEKLEQYRWHDLRKNPEDLPPKYHKVLIYSRLFGYSAAAITITGWYDGTSTRTVADAWCEINLFETDTNVGDKDINVRSKEGNE